MRIDIHGIILVLKIQITIKFERLGASMQSSIRIIDAIDFATMVHSGQTLRISEIPEIIHSFATAMLLSRYGYSEDLIIAGLLHGITSSNSEYSINDIEKKFGAEIAQYILDVSESDESLDWKTRKSNHIEHIRNVTYYSRILCCADMVHNLYSLEKNIAIQGGDVWKKFNASKSDVLWYYSSMCDSILDGYENMNIPIFDQLKLIIDSVILLSK